MVLTALIILLSFVLLGLAPFGDQAFLYKDGQQQMVDLFCWFKDVLAGKSSIAFSFSKYLGGSNFAVFSYYLSSPFNLLVVFFDKTGMDLFINIIYLLKSSFAALFASYYLCRRFRPGTLTKYAVTVVLATSYALSMYMISQSSNTMWLDGVYMLPLIIAGVEKLVSGKKSALFIISAALSVCFNWYTGIINLMFAAFWFLFELSRVTLTRSQEENLKVRSGRFIAGSFLRFAVSCAASLLISAVILLPTLTLLTGRSYNKAGISMLRDLSLIGSLPSVLSNYSFGTASVKGSVNLFAGSFVLLGAILLFFSSSKKLKEKLLYGIFSLLVVMAFYWQPLVALFSMFRHVEDFWYRYSYAGSFALVYLAAVFYLECDAKKTKLYIPPCIAAAFGIIVFFTTDTASYPVQNVLFAQKLAGFLNVSVDYFILPIVGKIVFPLLVSVVLSAAFSLERKDCACFRTSAVLMSIILFSELLLCQMVFAQIYSTADGPGLSSYTKNETELLQKIDDPSFYRVIQTSYHSLYHDLPASYSEPMAYGFNSVTAFVSAPDEITVQFLDRAGYPGAYETIPVTASENLALDSLLSVKYVMLPAGDGNNKGLQKAGSVEGFKDLYTNPYAVPPSFVIDKTGSYESSASSPALYLNDLYRYLSGTGKDIFVPAGFEKTAGREDSAYACRIRTDSDNVILYANFVTDTLTGAKLYINGEEYIRYSEETAPSMIRVLPVNGTVEMELVFNEKDAGHKVTDAQFYVLDTTALAELTDIMKSRAVSQYEICNGHCRFEVDNASEGTSLFTTIPNVKGWTVMRNGKKIDCDLTGSALMTVPLENGNNVIVFTYSVPSFTTGLAATFAGIVLLAGMAVSENKKKDISN